MHELSLSHIDQIIHDINRQEITFSHLREDLIDHVCCDVENEMQKGYTFSEAYHMIKQKIGSGRFKEIQKETLYAVDTKYRYMKNIMTISGVAGTIMFGFAALFKIQHWPGAGIMMTLGALILAFIFLPSVLGVLWKETHSKKRILLFISAFLAGMFFILGTLFKIQHWPFGGIILLLAAISGIIFFIPTLTSGMLRDYGKKSKRPVYILGAAGIILYAAGLLFKIQHWPLATFYMTLGVLILSVIAFPWFTYITWKNDSHIRVRFIFIIIGFIIIIVPGVLINLNLQNTYNNDYYTHQEQQQVLYVTRYSGNLTFLGEYRDSSVYQTMEQFHFKTAGLLSIIANTQTKMVAESEGKPGVPALIPKQIIQTETGPQIQYKLLSNPFQTSPVKDFLLPGSGSRQELNTALADYLNYVAALTTWEELQRFKALLDPSVFFSGELNDGAEISMMAGLHSTELLKNSILTVESCVLRSVAKR